MLFSAPVEAESSWECSADPGIAPEHIRTDRIDGTCQKGLMLTITVRFSEESSLHFGILWVSMFSQDAEHFRNWVPSFL